MQVANHDLPPPVNHVFVDFENLQDIDLKAIGRKSVHFTMLVGARQPRIKAPLVEKLLEHADSVEFIRPTTSGKNAFDFTLAYYLGRAVLADPAGYFHIISQDTGYDPLFEHLRSRHIRAHRHDDFATLTFGPDTRSSSAAAPRPVVAAPAHKQESKRDHCDHPGFAVGGDLQSGRFHGVLRSARNGA